MRHDPDAGAGVVTEDDVSDIRALCAQRHPHTSEEDPAWLAIHRLLRYIDTGWWSADKATTAAEPQT